MEVINKTRLDSKQLKKFLERGLRVVGGDSSILELVKVRWQRKTDKKFLGLAYCGDGWIELMIPRDYGGSQADVDLLAQAYQHELEHLILGWDHNVQMLPYYMLPVFWSTGVKIKLHPTR